MPTLVLALILALLPVAAAATPAVLAGIGGPAIETRPLDTGRAALPPPRRPAPPG